MDWFEGTRFMYRHVIEGQLAVNLKLVGWGHASAGVHQAITKLEGKEKYNEEHCLTLL